MLILGTKNTASQAVLTDGTITIGNVYRKYCKLTRTGLPTFASTNQSITLNADGIYHITATFVGSGTTAGVVTIQLLENGEPVTGVISSETNGKHRMVDRKIVTDLVNQFKGEIDEQRKKMELDK